MLDRQHEDSTTEFIRKTLCSEVDSTAESPKSVHELLPPLTSFNDVDFELYSVIAAVIHDYVDPWYQNITPDRELVDEVVHIVAHCTRALEQRVRKADLEDLALRQTPDVLNAHLEGTSLLFIIILVRCLLETSMDIGAKSSKHRCRSCTDLPHPTTSSCARPCPFHS